VRKLPPLKTLPAFELSAAHASFSAAAQELGLTHGAVSRQIKALEDHLGVTLFRRLSRRVELTEAGAALLPNVRQALRQLETAASQVSARTRQGPLVLSCLATFMMRWLIPRLYGFASAHPEIEVRLSASHRPVDFADGGIDVAIRLDRAELRRNVAVHRFLPDRVGPVASPALIERHRIRRPGDLSRLDLLHTETRPHAWADWLRLAGVGGIDPGKGPRFEHSYFLLEAAAGGLGAAIGSHPLVEQDLASGRLVAPFGFVASGASYCLLHPRDTAKVPKVAAFRAWLAAEAGPFVGKSRSERA
jgi:LysR family transcriptional regulator, glycine cleavage system transcriptional activator